MISDDISGLFGKDQPAVRFRQGTILTWDPGNGSNTIDLAGGVLTDVPVLNTGEAIALSAGHVVILMGLGLSWFIVGRVTPPGDPNFASASVAFGGEGNSELDFGLTAVRTQIVGDTMAVPEWADEAIVLAVANMTLTNPVGNNVSYIVQMNASIDGVGGGTAGSGMSVNQDPSINYLVSLSASAQRRIINPGPTIALGGHAWTGAGGNLPTDPNNIMNIDAIAVFRSTV